VVATALACLVLLRLWFDVDSLLGMERVVLGGRLVRLRVMLADLVDGMARDLEYNSIGRRKSLIILGRMIDSVVESRGGLDGL
jgi:hypothetical protein